VTVIFTGTINMTEKTKIKKGSELSALIAKGGMQRAHDLGAMFKKVA